MSSPFKWDNGTDMVYTDVAKKQPAELSADERKAAVQVILLKLGSTSAEFAYRAVVEHKLEAMLEYERKIESAKATDVLIRLHEVAVLNQKAAADQADASAKTNRYMMWATIAMAFSAAVQAYYAFRNEMHWQKPDAKPEAAQISNGEHK